MKILFLTPRPPFPPIKGDQIRPYHFIKELSRNHAIDLCTFYENRKELEGLKEMRKYCGRVEAVQLTPIQSYCNILRTFINFKPLQINYYYSGKMKRVVKNLLQGEKYDVIHIELERMMPYAQLGNGQKVVLDEIDALSLNMQRRASTERDLLKKVIFYFEYSLIKRFEQKSQRLWDACMITSQIDKDALHNEEIRVIPNGVDTAYFNPQKTEKDIDLIFTGNMGYFPNIDSAIYLCQEIMPKVREKYPNVKLYIVGANPGRKIQSLAKHNQVIVTGFVEDIRQYLNRSKLFVAPLRSGSGIQNKILEAMACELPVVTTSYGNAGIRAEEEKQVIVRDTPDELSQAITNLLEDKNQRNKLGEAARELAEKEFSWSSRAQSIEKIYQNLNV